MDKHKARESYDLYRSNPENQAKINELLEELLSTYLINDKFQEYVQLSDCLHIAAAQYISTMIYPVPHKTKGYKNRNKLYHALLSDFLFDLESGQGKTLADGEFGKETVTRLTEHYGLSTRRDSVKLTLNTARKHLNKMLFGYHTYSRYEEYLITTNDKTLVDFERFLAGEARFYRHLGFFPEMFSPFMDLNTPIQNDPVMRKPKRYWALSKPSIHLLEAYNLCYLEKTPKVDAILEPEWVIKAVKLSQHKLASELFGWRLSENGAPRFDKTKYSPTQAVFVDLSSSPFLMTGLT